MSLCLGCLWKISLAYSFILLRFLLTNQKASVTLVTTHTRNLNYFLSYLKKKEKNENKFFLQFHDIVTSVRCKSILDPFLFYIFTMQHVFWLRWLWYNYAGLNAVVKSTGSWKSLHEIKYLCKYCKSSDRNLVQNQRLFQGLVYHFFLPRISCTQIFTEWNTF